MTAGNDEEAPLDIRTVLAHTREQSELTAENTMALSSQLIATLEAELESLDGGRAPSDGARHFVGTSWDEFLASKLTTMDVTASHLTGSVAFIHGAPGPLEGAMVAADQAVGVRVLLLELRVLELGFRIVDAVRRYESA